MYYNSESQCALFHTRVSAELKADFGLTLANYRQLVLIHCVVYFFSKQHCSAPDIQTAQQDNVHNIHRRIRTSLSHIRLHSNKNYTQFSFFFAARLQYTVQSTSLIVFLNKRSQRRPTVQSRLYRNLSNAGVKIHCTLEYMAYPSINIQVTYT